MGEGMLCRPDKQQQLWAVVRSGVIIHYSRGLLGMQNLEGVPCDQAADASNLNPENLDTDQWLASAAELGAKYAVFVANQRNCRDFTLAVLIQSVFTETVALSEWKV